MTSAELPAILWLTSLVVWRITVNQNSLIPLPAVLWPPRLLECRRRLWRFFASNRVWLIYRMSGAKTGNVGLIPSNLILADEADKNRSASTVVFIAVNVTVTDDSSVQRWPMTRRVLLSLSPGNDELFIGDRKYMREREIGEKRAARCHCHCHHRLA